MGKNKFLNLKEIVILLVRFYQYAISPFLGNNCRFYPTCSVYMQTAIERFGLMKGIGLGTKRICRCHPFHTGGFDPVPEKKQRQF